MSSVCRRLRRTSLLLACLWAAPAAAAGLVDPRLAFHSLATPHFVIYFHQGEAEMARRLAPIAEEAWQTFEPTFGRRPPARTHVLLVDQSDVPNGWAFPLPRNTMFLAPVWPSGSEFLGQTDDWLRLVFTHEFAHLVHLDRSAGWARAIRFVFGRAPLAFPNLFLPAWQIEGIATFEETRRTGEGRLFAGDFQAILGAAARTKGLEPLDRVNGGLSDWPAGLAPYAYGGGFHAWLADRYGEPALAELSEETAGALPYLGSRAFRSVFDRSLGDLWREYQDSLRSPAMAGQPPSSSLGPDVSDPRRGAALELGGDPAGVPPGSGAPTRLTRHGFIVAAPRFAPPRCPGCPHEIVYSVRTPHEFPALYSIPAGGGTPQRLASRYLGRTSGTSAGAIVFDQQEIHRATALYSDLFLLDRQSGNVRALTDEARLVDPDLSPDGATIVAARQEAGRRALVLLRLDPDGSAGGAFTTLLSRPETYFSAPRWSPDGRSIAAERHRLGALPELVIVDAETGALRQTFSEPGSRMATPSWRSDGQAILAAVSPRGTPFEIVEFSLGAGEPRRLTRSGGGATWPELSPDGRTLVFVGYTIDGFDLFSVEYSPSVSPRRSQGGDLPPPEPSAAPATQPGPIADASRRYSPFPTLLPTAWTPLVEADDRELRLGVGTGGADALQYHAYAAWATWGVETNADFAPVTSEAPDWSVSYAYRRWQPTIFAGASNDTSYAFDFSEAGRTPVAIRERMLELGVLFPVQRVRLSHQSLVSVLRSSQRFVRPDGTDTRERLAARGGWAFSSAQVFGYSISQERGAAAGVTAEAVRDAGAGSSTATAFTGDLRTYLPGLGRHHVLALRAAGGAAAGDAGVRRIFFLGGAASNGSLLDFGREAISLLRGFPSTSFAGPRVALVNADYRWPLARPQRGMGTWPLFLHSLHAAVFADAGHAWSRTFSRRDIKTSAGIELSADVVAGFALPLTVTLGVAGGRDGAGAIAPGTTWYLRVGRAF